MQYICSREEMQAVDAYSIQQIGIPGIVLMEKAALSMEEEIISRFPEPVSVLIVTERGNNGGDGLALGRLLMARGYRVTFYEIGGIENASGSYEIQKNILDHLGGHFVSTMPDQEYDIVIDAIFGVGLKRAVRGIQKEAVETLNQKDGYRIAVDVPTGVDASDGHILGCSFQADLTITFGLNKIGLLLYPGAASAGEVVVKDIGFPKEAVTYVSPKTCSFGKEDLSLLPIRKSWSNKGSYGRVLLIAGSKNMAGAAYLSGLAAYRSGSGLVQIFTCEENREILQTLLPEAILTTWKTEKEALDLLPEALSWATVIGIGPGTGQERVSKLLLMAVLKEGKVPLVIDADGINNLAAFKALNKDSEFSDYPAGMILTPHLKEMERLLGTRVADIQKDIISAACRLADVKHVFVLKDARTIVSDGTLPAYINQSGNHGMSVGGSGDVLTGIICGFLAGGLTLLNAARLGVYCHGLAGDLAAVNKGYFGLCAKDIAEYLSEVID